MSCETVTLPGGGFAIVCRRGSQKQPKKPCIVIGCRRPVAFLCDQDVGQGRTCDRGMCASHAQEVGPDRHHCPAHPKTEAAHGR